MDPSGKLYVGGGISSGATLMIPCTYGLYGTGISVGFSTLIVGGYDKKGPFCKVCSVGSLTALVGVGGNVSAGTGVTVVLGKERVKDVQISVTHGIGVGAGVGATVEVNVDVDIDSKSIAVSVPIASGGISLYAAYRFSGHCIGCASLFKYGLNAPGRALKRMILCVKKVMAGIHKTFISVHRKKAKIGTIYKRKKTFSKFSLDTLPEGYILED